MTNPQNKKTHQQFINEIPEKLEIEIIGTYINADTKIEYKCKHGTNFSRPWQILTFQHCCRKGYYESGKMWSSRKHSNSEWSRILQPIYGDQYLWNSLEKIDQKDMLRIECREHGIFEQWTTSLKKGIGCKICVKEKEKARKQQQAWENFIESGAYLTGRSNVSKSETKWLNELGIVTRQKLLKDIGLIVDGYEESTRTVYLYHARF